MAEADHLSVEFMQNLLQRVFLLAMGRQHEMLGQAESYELTLLPSASLHKDLSVILYKDV